MRNPRMETLDAVGTGRPAEYATRRGVRQPVDVGRPSPEARAAGHGPDAATRQAWNDLEQISDIEARRLRLRMLELAAP